MKKHKVEIEDPIIIKDSGQCNLFITTEYKEGAEYTLIIHKNACALDKYIVCKQINTWPSLSIDVKDFSTKIIEESYSYSGKEKTFIDFTMSIAMIAVSAATKSPTGIVSGISGLMGSMYNMFTTDVSNQQLLKEIRNIQEQLKQVNEKLDSIEQKLDALQIITECGFDKNQLYALTNGWNNFISSYYIFMIHFC
ncbi:MAG: hypothetical protein HUJ63_05905 [Enterococcus sp.]|nr:hypothetical protein [Enterococcus sp.]